MTNLNDGGRPKTLQRGCYSKTQSEALRLKRNKATESLGTRSQTENPTGTEKLMEAVGERKNLLKALGRGKERQCRYRWDEDRRTTELFEEELADNKGAVNLGQL